MLLDIIADVSAKEGVNERSAMTGRHSGPVRVLTREYSAMGCYCGGYRVSGYALCT
jgi:hypothetical protein